MIQYPALIDGEGGAYGVVFPDIPGIAAMGDTVAEALVNAEAALVDYVVEAEADGEELAEPSSLESVVAPVGSRLVTVSLAQPRTEALASG